MNRAYALLEIKSIDDDARVIDGIASTPTPDRAGDVMEPKGAQFDLPLPFLWQHNQDEPIGDVFEATVTKDGIRIKARLAKIDEPGRLKDRLDEAWLTIKNKLVRGLSIGFKPLEYSIIEQTGGYHVLTWMWAELSAVTIPQNVEATILKVKQLDQAASGPHSSGVSDPLPVVRSTTKGRTMSQTIPEQITQFENTRAAKAAARDALMTKAAADNVTLDAAQTEEYDGFDREIKSIDAHLVRLRDREKENVEHATKITKVDDATKASELRGGTGVVSVKSNLPKGTGFTRYAMALAAGKGDMFKTIEYAKKFADSTPEVEFMVKNMDLLTKASVYPGTIADATWAGPLAVAQNLVGEFMELLRPATIVGRIPNLRKVPFNIQVPLQTAGSTVGWVGEGAPKPVTNLQLGTVALGMAKIAAIIVLTEELVKVSSPSAEAIVRADLTASIAAYMDTQFTDPAVAAVTNVSPASITNGTVAVTSAGTSAANALTDIKALVSSFTAANLSLANAVFLMSEANAFALAAAQNALAQPMFPGMAQGGGTLFGRPVLTSQALGNNIILVDAQGILYADDGGTTLDASREASVEMNTAPASPVVAGTILVSLWQQNLVGIRAERFVNWKRARLASVKYVVQAYV